MEQLIWHLVQFAVKGMEAMGEEVEWLQRLFYFFPFTAPPPQ